MAREGRLAFGFVALAIGGFLFSPADALGRVLISTTYQNASQEAGQILFEHEWDYDMAGNVKEQRETWPGALGRTAGTRVTGMDYDGAYRLTQEAITEPGGEMTVTHYTYDAANNRSTKAVTGGEEPGQWSYTSNALNQLTGFTRTSGTTGPSSVSYGYDANGNRTSRTADGVSDAYTWDAENRLIGVTKAGAPHSYRYDYRSRRISREEPASVGGGTQKTAVIFAGGLSVAEYGYTGTALQTQPTVEYVRGPDLGGGVGGLLYSLRGTSIPVAKYSYPNGRGDVVAQADQSGAVTWTASYEAFGTHKKETGTNLDRQRANTKEEDPTGLLNEGFRYRDLETGTWLSRDPAGFVDGPNLYAYCIQNPWSKFDPDGLDAVATVDATDPKKVKVNIELPINYSGDTSAERIGQVNNGIEKAWSGKFGKYQVETKVTTSSDPKKANQVELSDKSSNKGQNPSSVRVKLGWDSADFKKEDSAENTGRVSAHEAGHLMGLKDQYTETKDKDGNRLSTPNIGYEKNIMGTLLGKPSEDDITNIVDKARKPEPPAESAKPKEESKPAKEKTKK